jgi:hypothetical protein
MSPLRSLLVALIFFAVVADNYAQDRCVYLVTQASTTLGLAIGDALCPECPSGGDCPPPATASVFRAIIVDSASNEDIIYVKHTNTTCEGCPAGGKMGYTVAPVGGCSCKLLGSTGKSVPNSGSYTFSAYLGEVFFEGTQFASLASSTMNTTNSLDPTDSSKIIAIVTSASAVTNPFASPITGRTFGPSVWSLGTATGGCPNRIVFDKSKTSSSVLNISGCVVFNVNGSIAQNGVVTRVDGNFDPSGVRDILLFGQSDNFEDGLLGIRSAFPGISRTGLVLLLGSLSLVAMYMLSVRIRRA